MLVPLLSFFDAPEYTAFRAAYLHERGEAGSDVVNYIEFGDHTGWKRALDRGDYRTVIDLAQAQHDQEAERELNVTLVTLLGMSYSRLALHDKAVAVYENALGNLHQDSAHVPNLLFGLGQAHYRAGNRESAATEFREVVRREQEQPTADGRLLDAALSMLSRC